MNVHLKCWFHKVFTATSKQKENINWLKLYKIDTLMYNNKMSWTLLYRYNTHMFEDCHRIRRGQFAGRTTLYCPIADSDLKKKCEMFSSEANILHTLYVVFRIERTFLCISNEFLVLRTGRNPLEKLKCRYNVNCRGVGYNIIYDYYLQLCTIIGVNWNTIALCLYLSQIQLE